MPFIFIHFIVPFSICSFARLSKNCLRRCKPTWPQWNHSFWTRNGLFEPCSVVAKEFRNKTDSIMSFIFTILTDIDTDRMVVKLTAPSVISLSSTWSTLVN